jgi:FkbM family methyltransferase
MDVGAAYGSYTLTALAAGAAFVWAWSPQWFSEAREEDLLLESLRLNGWTEKCKVFRSGIYDKTGWLHTVTQEFLAAPTEDPEVIRVESMKEWVAREQPPRVDWLKLDVEGAEVEVLKDSEELIQKFRPKVHLENHVFKRPNVVQEVKDILVWTFGYKEVRTVPYHGVSHSLYHP